MEQIGGSKVNKIIQRQAHLLSLRSTFEQQWQEIVEQVGVSPNNFNQNTPTPGVKTTQKAFDSTAALAKERFVAAMSSTLTPRSQQWHKLKSSVPQLDESKEVNVYLEQITQQLFSARYDAKANFESQINECYSNLGLYGTACLFVDDEVGKGIRYKSIPLSQIFVAENAAGMIDTVYRKFKYTAYQAYDAWGDKVSDKIKTRLQTNPDEQFEFIHAVYPNETYESTKKDSFKFYSCYVEVGSKHLVDEGGYRTLPYAVSRYVTEPNETYGRSPAMMVLPDIKTLNRIVRSSTKQIHMLADPVLLAADDLALNGINLQPGAINYGGIDANGRQMIVPLQTVAQVNLAEELAERKRQTINEAFLVTLFQILVEQGNMTATEVEYRQQEKGQMLAPTMGRQQAELLAPMIERELDILAMYNVLPPMPEVLAAYGGTIEIQYEAPLNKIMRSNEALAILNTLQTAAGLAQFDPTILQMFDVEEAMRQLADIRGVPASVLKSPEEVAAMKQAQAQQAQMQQLLQAAPVVASSAKDMAQAQAASTEASPTWTTGA